MALVRPDNCVSDFSTPTNHLFDSLFESLFRAAQSSRFFFGTLPRTMVERAKTAEGTPFLTGRDGERNMPEKPLPLPT